jgi:hypothetical protein
MWLLLLIISVRHGLSPLITAGLRVGIKSFEIIILFLGVSQFPSTNNALEATNKQIKDTHSLRERLPFNKFVTWAEKMASLDWSAGRPMPNEVEEKIKPKLFANARQLHNSNRPVLFCAPTNNLLWFLPNNLILLRDKSKIVFDCLTVLILTLSTAIRRLVSRLAYLSYKFSN